MEHFSSLLRTAAKRLSYSDYTFPLVLNKADKQSKYLTAHRSWHSNFTIGSDSIISDILMIYKVL